MRGEVAHVFEWSVQSLIARAGVLGQISDIVGPRFHTDKREADCTADEYEETQAEPDSTKQFVVFVLASAF